MQKRYITPHYLAVCLQTAQQNGLNPEWILAEARITLSAEAQELPSITARELHDLFFALWQGTQDEFMGLAPTSCGLGTFALMMEYASQAQTLGAWLKKSAYFYQVVQPQLSTHLLLPNVEQNTVSFCVTLKQTDQDPQHLLQEFLLLLWQRVACWLVGKHIPVLSTQFAYAEPLHATAYQQMYLGEFEFNSQRSGFSFHEQCLLWPIVRSASEIELFISQVPELIFQSPTTDTRLATKVKTLLQDYPLTALPELPELAQQLCLSPRTLRRRLAQEGITLRELKQQLRQSMALHLLSEEHLSMADIAERLGFSEQAAFCRAFKRWTGVAPSQWQSSYPD